ncbi:L,D-transpeptidase family protein [Legionella maioricensis]|uniref:L,D-transpeptidase family protein n=1 Tax=Legionella maioricensis TaxID=2896528 RepID=A0A9X2IAG5_9GAMM|nr:L,D-transpeptidase family protein [Legionella maioricensis]MCL9684004.1 L,D-transpeptidase family protein [Legionella maioricensis]MCL9687951.1 L,D-transpeptidase family protein [Legionella maioricensis]
MTLHKRNNLFYILVAFLGLIAIFMIFKSVKNSTDSCQILVNSAYGNPPGSSSQVIVVQSLGESKAQVTACQRKGRSWQGSLIPTFPAVIGKGGIAPIGEKKEGDLKTPAGLYPLGEAFGTVPLSLKMDYKYITADDKFIDDVTSNRYNTWVNGKTEAKSYEQMLIEPYKIGVIINYNMDPTIKGAGSAIFMHLWRSINVPTAGCVAMEKKNLMALLRWLDKKKHPYIYITR